MSLVKSEVALGLVRLELNSFLGLDQGLGVLAKMGVGGRSV